MKVKQLIKELKKMPKNLGVMIAEHDNTEWEASGIAGSVNLFEKENYTGDYGPSLREDVQMLKDMPNKCVIIHG